MGVIANLLTNVFPTLRRSLLKHKLTLAQQRKMWAYIFVAVPFLYFIIVYFAAMATSFVFSFQHYTTISTEHTFIGLENYKDLLGKPIFRQSLRNTLVFAAVRVPVITVFSLGIAMMLYNIRRAKGFFRMLYFMPFVTSAVAIAWVFKFLYLPNFGLFTHLFDLLHMRRIYLLGEPGTALVSIIAVTIWASVGYYVIIFLAGLEDIPQVFYEAAMVDGASPWQRFRHITLPLLNRTLVLVVVLCLVSSLQTFTYVRLMSVDGFGGPLSSTITIPLLIYKEAFHSLRMGEASAIAVVFFVMVISLTLIQRRLLSREFEY